MTRVAILDDYQDVALALADWKSLGPEVTVEAFHERLSGEDTLAKRLGDFEVIVAMRERTQFPRSASRAPAETQAAGDHGHAQRGD